MNPDALGPKPLGCVEKLGDLLVREEKDGGVGHHAEEVREESAVQPAHALIHPYFAQAMHRRLVDLAGSAFA